MSQNFQTNTSTLSNVNGSNPFVPQPGTSLSSSQNSILIPQPSHQPINMVSNGSNVNPTPNPTPVINVTQKPTSESVCIF